MHCYCLPYFLPAVCTRNVTRLDYDNRPGIRYSQIQGGFNGVEENVWNGAPGAAPELLPGSSFEIKFQDPEDIILVMWVVQGATKVTITMYDNDDTVVFLEMVRGM